LVVQCLDAWFLHFTGTSKTTPLREAGTVDLLDPKPLHIVLVFIVDHGTILANTADQSPRMKGKANDQTKDFSTSRRRQANRAIPFDTLRND
jgi:hypothetical protein